MLVTSACAGEDATDASADEKAPTAIGESATITAPTAPAGASDTTAGTTATTLAQTVGTDDPQASAAVLYASWKSNDRNAASVVAEPAAIDGLFAAAPADYSLYNRCNTGEFGASTCLYRGDAGTIQFSMTQREEMWVVTMAIFSPA